jgi:hypothetical protein
MYDLGCVMFDVIIIPFIQIILNHKSKISIHKFKILCLIKFGLSQGFLQVLVGI